MTCGKLTVLLACAASALAAAACAEAAPVIVSDDAMKYASDGGASLFSRMSAYGLSSNRIAVFWDASRPGIFAQPFLDRAIPAATAAGVQVSVRGNGSARVVLRRPLPPGTYVRVVRVRAA